MALASDSNSGIRSLSIAIIATLVALLSWDSDAAHAEAKHKKPVQSAGRPTVAVKPTDSSAGSSAPTTAAGSPADPAKPDGQAVKQPDTWSEAEIADARAHCAAVLKRIHAVALPHDPIREGQCGAPAPIELISIGQNPEVALSPPAIVRCDLAEELVNWFENDVQPLARKHLKSAIVRIETMSSYSCRNAYGRKSTKLSEHALANALDIGGFVTASAASAEVLEDWGKPEREIRAEAEAQKRVAEQAAAKTAEAGIVDNQAQGALPSAVSSTAGATAAVGLVRSTIVEGVPAIGNPNRLGGPAAPSTRRTEARKPALVTRAIDDPDPEMRAFLHEAHDAACRIFGTTLGPEANADHRNHFHVDMAPRKFRKICD
ncbi:MAG: extensin family protein [Proteobacteria bacterium]|nr:extensin family protein [Pseudomonadota bacterium]